MHRLLSLILTLALPLPALAQAVQAPAIQVAEGTITLPGYRFNDAEHLSALRLHYLTPGTAQRDHQGHVLNAVLLMHGTTGSARAFTTADMAQSLYGPGQPLDISRLFLVMPDSIGVGALQQAVGQPVQTVSALRLPRPDPSQSCGAGPVGRAA